MTGLSEPSLDSDEAAAERSATAAADSASTDAGNRMTTDAESGASVERLLNRDEIDNLLGAPADRQQAERPAILKLVGAADIAYERLPLLEAAFERLAARLTASLRDLLPSPVELEIRPAVAQRLGDFLRATPARAMIAIFEAVDWRGCGLITVDATLIYAIVDVLLGGRRGPPSSADEQRRYTTIEVALIERLIRAVLADLSHAFAPIANVEFRFARIETNARFAAIAKPEDACVVQELTIGIADRRGIARIVLPYATFEPARDLLLQMFMGDKLGQDSIWERHLTREVWVADVDLDAVLDEQTVLLRDVLALRVGSVLPLKTQPESCILLRCGKVPVLTGRMGKVGDHIAVRVEDRLDRADRLFSGQGAAR